VTVPATPAQPTGAVYDRGYRPYEGERGGRSSARAALARLSIRRALGLRRPWRQKVLPWTLLGIATIPAIVNVGVGYVQRNAPIPDFDIITYRDYVGVSSMLLLFVAVTAPDVVCPDRRQRVLPLLFARPLVGSDYVAAKVGAIAAIVFGFGFVPQVVLFVGQLLVAREGALEYFTDNAEVLWQVPVSVAILAVYYAAVSVAISSFAVRRVVAAVAILALLLVTSTVAAIARGVDDDGVDLNQSGWDLVNVLGLPLHLRDIVFLGNVDPDGSLGGVEGGGLAAVVLYLAILVVCIAVLLRRYREVDL
jgi:ABC-2 type transport system permease protein